MIRRASLHTFLAVCLVLSSLTAVVAQTRMAAADGYCGTNAPQLLLDASGLPHLDADGHAVAAPDCPTCQLALAASFPTPHTANASPVLLHVVEPLRPNAPSPLNVHLGGQARAPPNAA